MTQISLRGIEKTFGKTVALRGIDLEIKSGELMTLVGPSGCGKSTLLNIIAGLENPSRGSIHFDGKSVLDLTPKERDIAFVFQTYALYPHMKVRKNLAFPLEMAHYPRSKIEARVRETASLLQINELLDRKPAELSGGQRQRVALGRAMVRRPAIFLLDEPLSNLDAKLRLETRAELKRLHRELATTFVYVTHDQTEAMTLSQRLAVMRDGEILQIGTPEEVYRSPQNTYVATFIGSPATNLLPVRIVGESGELEFGGQRLSPPADLIDRVTGHAQGGEFVLGVRPEHIRLGTQNEKGLHPATIRLTEPLGAETYVHLIAEGQDITARAVSDFAGSPGDEITFTIDWHHVGCFDRSSGKRLF